ncbi:MAG: phosphotransferase [Streptosporangiales bacterium]|nr:phosphotransferase [Streptosporangiales bacterium]
MGTSSRVNTEVELLALLDRIPAASGHPRTVEDLPGGLTNRNVKVTTPQGSVVVRISASDGALLSIDRDHEHANSTAAARAGVGAPVVDYLRDDGVLVVGFLEGRTLGNADLNDPAILPRVADACRRLHAGPRFVNDFDMFEVQLRYLDVVRRNGFRLPDRYLEFMPVVDRIRGALGVRPLATVPCNNDLLPENFIDDGERLWLIDYEYAGNNDPCFELGNIWSEADMPVDHLDALVGAYYGRPSPARVARARLFGLMSKFGWTLWASIQDGGRSADFDFWSWGMEKYDRAVAEFDGPDLERLVEDVQGED